MSLKHLLAFYSPSMVRVLDISATMLKIPGTYNHFDLTEQEQRFDMVFN
jgi:hypothetical protein